MKGSIATALGMLTVGLLMGMVSGCDEADMAAVVDNARTAEEGAWMRSATSQPDLAGRASADTDEIINCCSADPTVSDDWNQEVIDNPDNIDNHIGVSYTGQDINYCVDPGEEIVLPDGDLPEGVECWDSTQDHLVGDDDLGGSVISL